MAVNHTVPVLIVGAGPTGLVLALWLTRRGIPVRLIDKCAEAGTTSRALAVQGRTLEFYGMLGIAQRVVAGGVKVAAVNLWARGRKAARVPMLDLGSKLSPFGFPLVFPQDAHEKLLVAQLETLGVTVERKTELLGFTQNSSGVDARLRLPDGSEAACSATYVAGCDGAHSAVRTTTGIGFPGGTYEGLFYVADVEAEGPPTDDELHVDLEEADLLITFPLKGKGRIRLVGDVHVLPGMPVAELTFEDVSPRALSNLGLRVTKVNWFSTYKVHHRVADRFRSGRAFLLGDAGHIHSPVGGQGMNTGIGDAVNLAWKLAAVLKGQAEESILDTYEAERIGFARRLVATTDRAFTFATARGRLASWIRTRIVPRIVPLLVRSDRRRAYLFRTVSQIDIRYRSSPLSQGAAGKVHAGDRLPWVKGELGDNFAPLSALDWQAHVYGDARPEAQAACEKLNLPLHVFAWSTAAETAGLARTVLYLIRPDGYIGAIDAAGTGDGLMKYRPIGGR